MKIKLAITITALLALSITTAQAATNKYWKPVDKKGLVHKLCDNGNLIYIYKNGYSGGIFVFKGGC